MIESCMPISFSSGVVAGAFVAVTCTLCSCGEYPDADDSDGSVAISSSADVATARAAAEGVLGTTLPSSALVSNWRIAGGRDTVFLFRIEISEADWQTFVSSSVDLQTGTVPLHIQGAPIIPIWAQYSSSSIAKGGICLYLTEPSSDR